MDWVILVMLLVTLVFGAICYLAGLDAGRKQAKVEAPQAPRVKKKVGSYDASNLLEPITPAEQRLEKRLNELSEDVGGEEDGE